MTDVMTPDLTLVAPIATENEQQPMSHYVSNGMRTYFTGLGDAKPVEVYEYWLQQNEAPLLKITMDYCSSNQTRAAKILGLSRGTLRKKLKKYGLLSVSNTVTEETDTQSMAYYVARGMRRYYSSLGETKAIEVYEMWLEQTEAPLLKETMQYCNNNQTRAAKILGLSRGTLRKKLKKYDLL